MYAYGNNGNLPIPQLPARDLSDEEFAAVVSEYAKEFGALPGDIAVTLLAAGYYVKTGGSRPRKES